MLVPILAGRFEVARNSAVESQIHNAKGLLQLACNSFGPWQGRTRDCCYSVR